MADNPIKWVTKYEQIERMIRERIAKGELKAGDKLESEETIAQKLGVHRFTVNKALATLVREGLLKRIQGRGTFVNESRVRPSTGEVAVLYSSEAAQLGDDTFFGNILAGLREESGTQVTLLGTVRRAGSMIGPPLDEVAWDRYDGLILMEIFDEDYIATAQKASPVPVVVVDYDPANVSIDHVVQDNYGAGRQAVEYLLGLGHRRIAHAGEPGPPEKEFVDSAWQNRRKGWADALEAAGIGAQPFFLPLTGRGSAGAEEHMKQILGRAASERPTAFFGATDDIAIRLMQTAQDAGVQVPDEMSFVGFGDSSEGRVVRPRLTTFQAYVIEMGRWAWRRLRQLREGKELDPHRHVIPVKLVERDSCAKAKA